ncbi:lysostaphin resistance A-like protein [Fructilactobacillus sp. Tb1]|uniref:CPBP family intramembrane glutamic endopeptidase n=1 Tax=Fructilactobacillus sp. Tb1 TaxID=3422304 RepID=UPI003D28C1E6
MKITAYKKILLIIALIIIYQIFMIHCNIHINNLPLFIVSKIGLIIYFVIANKYLIQQPINISFKLSSITRQIIIILSIILGLMCLFNQSNIISAISIGLIASIPEEYIFRGLILGLLLFIFKNSNNYKTKFYLPIIISALLFAAVHIVNISTQSITFTLFQMIQVFGMGIMFACLYIRTKNLVIPIFVHFTIDTFLSLLPTTSEISRTVTPSVIVCTVLSVFLYTIIGLIILKPVLK